MNGAELSKTAWISCPQCHRPMPPELSLCKECQVKDDLKMGIEDARNERYTEALDHFKAVCTAEGMDEERAHAFYYSGCVFSKLGNVEKAYAAWKKCIALEPGHQKARQMLVEYILTKPKRRWDEFERQLVEGSEFAHARPRASAGGGGFGAVLWLIVLVVLVLVGGAGYLGFNRAVRYFTFDRHIEEIERLAATGQVARSLQYFNDHFRQGESAHRRQQAEQRLGPVFKSLAQQKLAEGDATQARQLFQIAAGFSPGDREVQDELRRLQSSRQVAEEPPSATNP